MSDSPPMGWAGAVKLEVCRRLVHDWPALADILGIDPADRAAFPHGREPQGVWEWLETRGRLGELPDALRAVGRGDLAGLLPQPTTAAPGEPAGTRFRLYSGGDSAERGEVSLLAIVETLAAVGLSAWVAWGFGTVEHVAIGACLAPLLLLRTDYSVHVGLRMLKQLGKPMSNLFDWAANATTNRGVATTLWTGGGVLLVASLFLGLPILCLLVRVAATVFAFLHHPVRSVRAIPDNWKRTVLATDLFTPPEPIPGVGLVAGELGDIRAFIDPATYMHVWRSSWTGHPGTNRLAAAVIVLAPMGALIFLPAVAYRWSLKATSIVWSPLLWAVRSAFKDEAAQPIARLRYVRDTAFGRVAAVYSACVLAAFAGKCVLYAHWNRFAEWFNQAWPRQLLAVYVQPAEIPWWQVAAAVNAALFLALFLYAWNAVARLAVGLPVDARAADRVVKSAVFVRSLLTAYVIACTLYLTVNAARGWPWPRLGSKLFPWE